MKLMIVTGRSGSGKSICLHVLEDLGYYCIDNLPCALLPALVQSARSQHQQLAVSIDARNAKEDLQQLPQIIDDFIQSSLECEVIFLDADDDTLRRRYAETRRKHPLTDESTSLSEALAQDKALLQPLHRFVDLTINTSQLTLHQLRDQLHESLKYKSPLAKLSLVIMSFGYKFGVPTDVDYLFDVRCLPNPYWQPHLSAFTGRDPEVEQFLEKHPKTQRLFDDIHDYLNKWLPHFEAANRRYLTVGIGCTGGQHRSVYVAEKLFTELSTQDYQVQLRHRELT